MLTVIHLEPRLEDPEHPLPDPCLLRDWLAEAGITSAYWLVDGRVMAPVALRDMLCGAAPAGAPACHDHSIARLESASAGLTALRKMLANGAQGEETICLIDAARWRPFDLSGLLSAHESSSSGLTVALESAEAGGCADMDRTGRITRLLSPVLRDPLGLWRPVGAAVLDAKLILPESKDPMQDSPTVVRRSVWAGLLPELVRQGNVVLGHPVERAVPVSTSTAG